MSWEKVGKEDKLLTWNDIMQAEEYVYTVGLAGEEFFNGLKQRKIIGSRCPKCGKVYLPPRLYCEDCFVKNEYLELNDAKPYIDSYTIVYKDTEGERLKIPQTIALIRFQKVSGGLLAFVSEGDVEIGKEVEILEYKIPLVVRVK